MKRTIKALLHRYRDMLAYLVFGGLTTAVNIVSYWILAHLCGLGVMGSTVLAWVLSVVFAYVTNRIWVFHSEARGMQAIFREMASFFSCRFATGIVDWGCMLVFADILGWWDLGVKVAANVLVIILNYLASKWVIFRQPDKGNTK